MLLLTRFPFVVGIELVLLPLFRKLRLSLEERLEVVVLVGGISLLEVGEVGPPFGRVRESWGAEEVVMVANEELG